MTMPCPIRLLAPAALLLWSGVAWGAPLAEGRACLVRNDVPCALEVAERRGSAEARSAREVAFAAQASFYAGDFEEAHALLARAVDLGWEDRWDDLGLYERTAEVTQGWTVAERGRFQIRYQPGIDAVLLDDAFRALETAERNLAPHLGAPPPGPLALEVYPDGRSFIAASSLTRQDVLTTGVVALSKWSRLLITSPRALGRGYTWQDTIVHEYIHLVVTHHTDDRAPVWLQEAIAKYLDTRWRDGQDRFRLSVSAQGLLAAAVESGDFVSFDDMHPSLAKLPSQELAALAYAQLSTLMAFAFQQGGEDILLRVMPRVRAGEDPQEVLATEAGFQDFAELERGWLEYVGALDLVQRNVASMPTVVDGGDEVDTDPLLHERRDLARFVRLGDLLRERGRHKAALVEYGKAIPDGEPRSPLLSNRIAQSLVALGRLDEAQLELEASLANYPEFPLTHKTLGQILEARGQLPRALRSFRSAAELNPFDPEVQRALSDLYARLGDEANASRHQGYLHILRPGLDG